jgi:hypothetical protein
MAGLVAGCADSVHKAGNGSPPTSPATSASVPPQFTSTDRAFIADMREKLNFGSDVKDQDIVRYGQQVCEARQTGSSQSAAEHIAKTNWTNVSVSEAYKMTRLAESDNCSASLPAMRWHTVLTFIGSGQQNSDTFRLHPGNTKLRVTYSYSNNSSGFGGDNFIADLVSSTDDLQIANEIAVSGGKTTLLYPDLSFGGSRSYHLEIQATGSWSFTIKQKY